MVYVADLGRWINIRPDSENIDLLWKVQDTRPFAIERARLVLNPDIVRRTLESCPEQTSYTYYFVSPHVAAAQFGRQLDMNNERVIDFYDRRDALLYDLKIYNREFFYDPRFEVIEPDQKKNPTSLALNAENPVLMVEVVRDADGFVRPKITREMREAIRHQKQQARKKAMSAAAAPSGAGEFVEDDEDVLIA
jgi:hypothetical protein